MEGQLRNNAAAAAGGEGGGGTQPQSTLGGVCRQLEEMRLQE